MPASTHYDPFQHTYIHYGHSSFDPNLFKPVENYPFTNKCSGGLWSSPTDSMNDWKSFCECNDLYWFDLKRSFRFRLHPDSKVLVIAEGTMLNSINPAYFSDYCLHFLTPESERRQQDYALNYEHIAKDYDAILVLPFEDDILMDYFHHFDADTLLILNPKSVLPIAKAKKNGHTFHPVFA